MIKVRLNNKQVITITDKKLKEIKTLCGFRFFNYTDKTLNKISNKISNKAINKKPYYDYKNIINKDVIKVIKNNERDTKQLEQLKQLLKA